MGCRTGRFCPCYLFILLRLSACRACTPSAPHQNQGCTEEPRQDADDSSSSFDCPSFSPPLSLIVPPAAPITINLPASQPQPRGLAAATAAAAISCDPVSVLFPFTFFVFSLHVLRLASLLVRGSVCNRSHELCTQPDENSLFCDSFSQ